MQTQELKDYAVWIQWIQKLAGSALASSNLRLTQELRHVDNEIVQFAARNDDELRDYVAEHIKQSDHVGTPHVWQIWQVARNVSTAARTGFARSYVWEVGESQVHVSYEIPTELWDRIFEVLNQKPEVNGPRMWLCAMRGAGNKGSRIEDIQRLFYSSQPEMEQLQTLLRNEGVLATAQCEGGLWRLVQLAPPRAFNAVPAAV